MHCPIHNPTRVAGSFPGRAKAGAKSARDDAGMKNALTVIVPIGDFTATLARMVTKVLDEAALGGRTIVISLQWTARWSWDALCDLEQSLRVRYRDVRVRFTAVSPTHRALLREVGLGREWIVEEVPAGRTRRVLLAA
jgi:hypothetical protein